MASASTHHQEDDGGETWELVRAFAEDTNSIMGTIWPPSSYNCSYCRREFRSAQALGGHMNVHRRDRANNYYQQTHNYNNPSAASAPTSTTSNPPAADLSSNKVVPPPNRIDSREPAALCLLCQFPSPSSRSAGTAFGGPLSLNDACLKETVNRGGGGGGGGGFIFHSNWCRPNGSCCSLVPPPSTAGLKNTASSARKVELVSVVTTAEPENNNDINAGSSSSSVKELSGGLELDLELRLGHTQGTR